MFGRPPNSVHAYLGTPPYERLNMGYTFFLRDITLASLSR